MYNYKEERDKQVAIRNGMVMALQDAICRGNNGDLTVMLHVLENIKKVEGYEVTRIKSGEILEVNGEQFTNRTRTVIITEYGKTMFILFRSRIDHTTSLEVDPYHLMTNEEIEQEEQFLANMDEELEKLIANV